MTPSNAYNDLPVLGKLIQEGQPQFGVFKRVKQINYLAYQLAEQSPLISQKTLSKWHKELRANQFAFIQIVHAPYRICIAVATIKIASSAFAYIYNESSQELTVVDAIRPFGYQSKFSGDHQNGVIQFSHSQLRIHLTFTSKHISLNLDSSQFAITATLARKDNALAVCTPTGRRGWTFTQKEPLTVTGDLIVKESALASDVIEFNHESLANLDWTLGFMRHITNWYWACINTRLPDGCKFMLNLSMGVNETGISENACWIDGKIFYLPPVLFCRGDEYNELSTYQDRLKQSESKQWTISHQNLGWSHVVIELTFAPISVYKKTDNYGVIASIFEQWIGEYSGIIILNRTDNNHEDEVVIKLDKVLGLAEDHFAKW